MLLMIDNYDSFTFNLVHYFQALGQEVVVYRNNEISLKEIEQLTPQYIVISPGPCDPDSAGISLDVVKEFAGKIPLLGVCLGHQCIAQHFGASVVKAKKVMHGKTSKISHNQQGLFAELNHPLQVTRYHSLIVDKQSLPAELTMTAWSQNEQGEVDEIMALEHKTLPISSVQFHPESILTEQGQCLLANFIKQFKNYPIS
ncbi:anthranilate synthase component II [Colwellia psychrerythraea]|uniref:Anthranilate synthase component II n=1 Tax=Colwellia psychrerythraea (strain 34H / ATCC BAA-681) TaxID=167879 RepID=Q488X6_COLP3|nr:aminodeoxychorismate/anthranilate synthase component II [Colwellia psychrerythraea]AAZ24848.1 anthranilate synthase component II [Colwellia psychrerythraea 34H]